MLSAFLLTLNLWGLPDVGFIVPSPLREARVAAVCEVLRARGSWDVVVLQEAWVAADRRTLTACGYPFSADLNDSVRPIDSGLMILSRHPLSDIQGHTFVAKPEARQNLTDGEAFARKGALMAKVKPAGAAPYWVVTTHLISRYAAATDIYLETRRAQLRELATWVAATAGGEPVLLGGDLNIGPADPLWAEVTASFPGFTDAPGSAQACTICPPNSMHSRNEGKVDHWLGSPGIVASEGGTALDQPVTVEGVQTNYSDHFGWQTRFSRP